MIQVTLVIRVVCVPEKSLRVSETGEAVGIDVIMSKMVEQVRETARATHRACAAASAVAAGRTLMD
jgi:hypothetical protein